MTPSDGRQLATISGWGRATATTAVLERPTSPERVAEALAAGSPRGTIARGLGRSYGDAAQNAGGQVLAMTRLDRVRAFDQERGAVVVEAGCSLDRLLRLTVPAGWWLSSTPGTRFVTMGGAIANDVHGKNHLREGSIRRAVRALELLTAAGDLVLVTPEGTPELFAATVGGLGLTGIVVTATLQLQAIETAWMRQRVERAADLEDLLQRMDRHHHPARYSVAWVDCLARGRQLGRSVITHGDHATRSELPADVVRARRFAPRQWLALPPAVPDGLLSRRTLAAFNQVKFTRTPPGSSEGLRSLSSFFYPLDAVRGWNRMYGRRGFVQYQFAVPRGAEDTLRRIVGLLAAERCPSFLAVLKRLGAGGGMLSFPLPGWTLAVDIPAGQPGLGRLLDRVDELVVDAAGRVYLAKDSRLRRPAFEAMYPDLAAWRRVRQQVDPDGVLRSDLGRRLGLSSG